MNDLSEIVTQSVGRLFQNISDGDIPQSESWQAIIDLGLPELLLPEQEGGMGYSFAEAEPILRGCGYHALPFPIGETVIGNKLLHEAGINPQGAPLAFAQGAGSLVGDNMFTGEIFTQSPTLSGSFLLVNTGDDKPCVLIDSTQANERSASDNVAGETRDSYRFEGTTARQVASVTGAELFGLGAFLRTAQIGGALAACTEKTISYSQERSQFGRELRKFQAIQHQIALLTEESAAVFSGSGCAAAALDSGESDFAIACAKLRANMAAGASTLIAHQVHGAIGITEEYPLHRFTNRLWAWRGEFGNDRYWAGHLGRTILSCQTDSAWEYISRRNL